MESQSLSLSSFQIASEYCVAMTLPNMLVRCDSGVFPDRTQLLLDEVECPAGSPLCRTLIVCPSFYFVLPGSIHFAKWSASRRRSRCGSYTRWRHLVTRKLSCNGGSTKFLPECPWVARMYWISSMNKDSSSIETFSLVLLFLRDTLPNCRLSIATT